MSTKRKWDQTTSGLQAEGDVPFKATKADEGKSASEVAVAIAAKIAAQISAGGHSTSGSIHYIEKQNLQNAEFTHAIDINDAPNRYMLTNISTQAEIYEQTGAYVSTMGTWYSDRSKATEEYPPLYLQLSAPSREIIRDAGDIIKELLALGPDLASFVEDGKVNEPEVPAQPVEDKKEQPFDMWKRPEMNIPVSLEAIPNFDIRAKITGPQDVFIKYIQIETETRVKIKGMGSGFVEDDTGRESEEPMYIHITGKRQGNVDRAKVMFGDLLKVVRGQHSEAQVAFLQQQTDHPMQ